MPVEKPNGGTSGPLTNADLDLLWLAIAEGRRLDALDYMGRIHRHKFTSLDVMHRIHPRTVEPISIRDRR